MENLREIHNEAMNLAEFGDMKKIDGNIEKALELYAKAYELEKEAATIALKSHLGEPTISILLKSAASLAMRCKLNRDAEKLICLALSGEPPTDIADELKVMLKDINSNRHLSHNKNNLSENKTQIIIGENRVEYGYTKSNKTSSRLQQRLKKHKTNALRKIQNNTRKIPPKNITKIHQKSGTSLIAASMTSNMKAASLDNSQVQGLKSLKNIDS